MPEKPSEGLDLGLTRENLISTHETKKKPSEGK